MSIIKQLVTCAAMLTTITASAQTANLDKILLGQADGIQNVTFRFEGTRFFSPNQQVQQKIDQLVQAGDESEADKAKRKQVFDAEVINSPSLDISGDAHILNKSTFSVSEEYAKKGTAPMDLNYYASGAGDILEVNEHGKAIRIINNTGKLLGEFGVPIYEAVRILTTCDSITPSMEGNVPTITGKLTKTGSQIIVSLDPQSSSIQKIVIKQGNVVTKTIEVIAQNPTFPAIPLKVKCVQYTHDGVVNLTEVWSFKDVQINAALDPTKFKYTLLPGYSIRDETSGVEKHLRSDDLLAK